MLLLLPATLISVFERKLLKSWQKLGGIGKVLLKIRHFGAVRTPLLVVWQELLMPVRTILALIECNMCSE